MAIIDDDVRQWAEPTTTGGDVPTSIAITGLAILLEYVNAIREDARTPVLTLDEVMTQAREMGQRVSSPVRRDSLERSR